MARRSALEKQLGVTFKDGTLLRRALVHSSYVNENTDTEPESNERLEFLGDAVLGLIVADELFAAHAGLDEGRLTELRARLVRGDTLATAARRLELGDALLLGRGEEAGGGRDRPTNLAHVYEAVIGAIFLDRGLSAARRFIRHTLQEEFELSGEGIPLDPKSELQVRSQSLYQSAPRYRLIETEGPDHERRFTIEVMIDSRVLGTGRGGSKQQAEKEAAQMALERLDDRSRRRQPRMSGECT